MSAQAGGASWRQNSCPGFDEGGDITNLNGVKVNVPGSRGDEEAGIRVAFSAPEYIDSDFQVFETTIGAGTQKNLVDACAL